MQFGDGVEIGELERLIEGRGLVGELLPVDHIEVRLPEICLVADIDPLEAALMLADQKLAQVFDRLLLHYNLNGNNLPTICLM